MSHRGCPGAASGDSWGQNRLGSRARSETSPRAQLARAPGGEVGAGCPVRARRLPVASAGRAEPAGRRAMRGRTGHALAGDAPRRGHRGSESDRTARASNPSAVRFNPTHSEERVGPKNEIRGMTRRLATPGPRLYPSMAVSRCEARCAGRPAPVYTLVSEWMFPGSPRTGFQRTFELHAGTVRTGEWREGS